MAIFDEIDGTLDALFADTLIAGLSLPRPLALAWTSGAAYDPDAGGMAGGTPVNVSTAAVPQEWTTYERALGLVRVGDVKLLVQGKAFATAGEPPEGAVATYAGRSYRLRSVFGRKNLQGANIVFSLHLQEP